MWLILGLSSMLVCYFFLLFFCKIKVEEINAQIFMSLGLNRNGTGASRRNRQDDDLPPYSPPSPRTKAAMADLPPSYEETNNMSSTMTMTTTPTPTTTTMTTSTTTSTTTTTMSIPNPTPTTTIIVSTNTLNSITDTLNSNTNTLDSNTNPLNSNTNTLNSNTNTLNSNTNPLNSNTNTDFASLPPTTYVINPNINAIPDIVIDPIHTHTATEE